MTTKSLPRKEAAGWLNAFGLSTTPDSLATMANRGGGPAFFKIGNRCFYRVEDLKDWVRQRCSRLLDSTSDRRGRELEDLFAPASEDLGDLEDDYFDTGQPDFDEVTRLNEEGFLLQEQVDQAGAKYDQQFML